MATFLGASPSGGGSIGPGPILPGLPPSQYSSVYGGIPSVPDPAAAVRDAIAANLANFGGLTGFGAQMTAAQEQQLLGNYAAAIPNYAGLTGQMSGNISSDLAGQVPQGVINLLQQQGAERGIATGAPGSDNANAAYLRALGLTSLGLKQQGLSELNAATAAAPVVKPFDISSLLMNPNDIYSARQLASLYASAPNPQAAGTAGVGDFQAGLRAGYNSAGGGRGGGGYSLPGGSPYQPIPRPPATGGGWRSPPSSPPADTWSAEMPALPAPLGYGDVSQNLMSGYQYGIPTSGYQLPDWVGNTFAGPAGMGPYADQPTGDYASLLANPFLTDQPYGPITPPPEEYGSIDDYFGDYGGY